MARTVLVVGATGILRPAARALTAQGDAVIGIARENPVEAADASILTVDARDADALAGSLEGSRWDDGIVYAPAVGDSSLAYLRDATPGRVVVVFTSGHADPARGSLVVARDTVQLGWRAQAGPGEDVWHSPEEVSAAALQVLADGEPRTVGVVRPWSDRP